jgi:hypothetical protein
MDSAEWHLDKPVKVAILPAPRVLRMLAQGCPHDRVKQLKPQIYKELKANGPGQYLVLPKGPEEQGIVRQDASPPPKKRYSGTVFLTQTTELFKAATSRPSARNVRPSSESPHRIHRQVLSAPTRPFLWQASSICTLNSSSLTVNQRTGLASNVAYVGNYMSKVARQK